MSLIFQERRKHSFTDACCEIMSKRASRRAYFCVCAPEHTFTSNKPRDPVSNVSRLFSLTLDRRQAICSIRGWGKKINKRKDGGVANVSAVRTSHSLINSHRENESCWVAFIFKSKKVTDGKQKDKWWHHSTVYTNQAVFDTSSTRATQETSHTRTRTIKRHILRFWWKKWISELNKMFFSSIRRRCDSLRPQCVLIWSIVDIKLL